MTEISPLHRVIDAGRWEAESLLGRLIVIVHAAVLDTGFVSHPHAVPPKSGRVPRRVGATASTLSLGYAAPGLRYAVVLRISAQWMRIVFYVRVRSDQGRGPGLHWVCVDARVAAPLLSGGLDDTARALTSHGACGRGLAALWRELTGKLCRGALVDLCRANAFVLLPGDIMLEILGRLVDGLDLLRVADLCCQYPKLVEAEHKLYEERAAGGVNIIILLSDEEDNSGRGGGNDDGFDI
uniref:F-box domain-containing protein n=1 Tax=Aegilops tauschii TaxID=37682 RepID=N1QSV8_AEGTA